MTKAIDRLLDNESYAFISSMIGKKLISIHHEEPELCKTVYIVQLNLEDDCCCLESCLNVVDYYGAPEDIPVLQIKKGSYDYDSPSLHTFTVEKTIQQISVVNYHIHSNNPELADSDYIYSFTKGIILTFEDRSQLSFERLDNFIEMIVVNQGKNLIAQLEPIEDYIGEQGKPWELSSSVEIKEFR